MGESDAGHQFIAPCLCAFRVHRHCFDMRRVNLAVNSLEPSTPEPFLQCRTCRAFYRHGLNTPGPTQRRQHAIVNHTINILQLLFFTLTLCLFLAFTSFWAAKYGFSDGQPPFAQGLLFLCSCLLPFLVAFLMKFLRKRYLRRQLWRLCNEYPVLDAAGTTDALGDPNRDFDALFGIDILSRCLQKV